MEEKPNSDDKLNILNEKIEFLRNNEFFEQIKEKNYFPFFDVLKKYLDLGTKEETNNDKMKDLQAQFKFENEIKYYIKVNIKETEEHKFKSAFLFIFSEKIILMNEEIKLEIEKEKEKNNGIIEQEKDNETKRKENEERRKNDFIIIEYSHFFNYYLIYNIDDVLGINFEYYDNDFIKKKELSILSDYEKDTYLAHHFIKKYAILEWQRLFETTILLDFPNLIYNNHFVLIKVNKWSSKQERTLVITNSLLLNLKHDFKKEKLNFKIKNVQWADSIAAISKLELFKSSENVIVVYIERVKNNSQIIQYMGSNNFMKFKPSREFQFYNTTERNSFLALLRKNFYALTKTYLKIELKDKK